MFKEHMVLISSFDSKYEETISPAMLNANYELKLDWGEDFQIWHDYWFGTKSKIQLKVDTSGLIFNLLDRTGSWAIVPLKVALSYNETKKIKISTLSNPPPSRTIYKIKNIFTRPSIQENLSTFEKYLEEFIINNTKVISQLE